VQTKVKQNLVINDNEKIRPKGRIFLPCNKTLAERRDNQDRRFQSSRRRNSEQFPSNSERRPVSRRLNTLAET
jgi:hypothetical protein